MTATAAERTPTATSAGPVVPARYRCSVSHVRRAPVRNAFRYPMALWLVDADALPRAPGLLARFRAADHLGDPAGSLGGNLRGFLTGRGVRADGRILLLTQPRVLGYAFNPLSVWWCHRADGSLAAVVAEVHNTYGERHAYLLEPEVATGTGQVDKEFYVSPFYPVAGRYRMRLPMPGDRLDLLVGLQPPTGPGFTARLTGERSAAGVMGALADALRRPPLFVSARIRRQGIGLWLRGLPLVRRPARRPQEGVQ